MSDIDEPVTAEWLVEIGFKRFHERYINRIVAIKFAGNEQIIFDPANCKWRVRGNLLKVQPSTRGEARRLLGALGIRMKPDRASNPGAEIIEGLTELVEHLEGSGRIEDKFAVRDVHAAELEIEQAESERLRGIIRELLLEDAESGLISETYCECNDFKEGEGCIHTAAYAAVSASSTPPTANARERET